MFEFIKAVFDTVLDMLNAAYYDKPLILISHHQAVNERYCTVLRIDYTTTTPTLFVCRTWFGIYCLPCCLGNTTGTACVVGRVLPDAGHSWVGQSGQYYIVFDCSLVCFEY